MPWMILISGRLRAGGRATVPDSACSVTVILIQAAVGVSWQQGLKMVVRSRFAGAYGRGNNQVLQRHARRVPTLGRTFPPLSNRFRALGRQHYVPILAALELLDANNHLRLVDIVLTSGRPLAGSRPAPIAKNGASGTEAVAGQPGRRLVRAHQLTDYLGLPDVIDLCGKISRRRVTRNTNRTPVMMRVAIADAYARSEDTAEPADVRHSRRV